MASPNPVEVVPKARAGSGESTRTRSADRPRRTSRWRLFAPPSTGIGRGRNALSAGHRAQPRLFSRPSMVRDRLSGVGGPLRRSACRNLRWRVIWIRSLPSWWKAAAIVKMLQRDYAGGAGRSTDQLSSWIRCFIGAYSSKARVFSLLGRYEEAIACWSELARWQATFPSVSRLLARHAGARRISCGRPAALLDELHEIRQNALGSLFLLSPSSTSDWAITRPRSLIWRPPATNGNKRLVASRSIRCTTRCAPSPVFKGCWSELVSYRKQFG